MVPTHFVEHLLRLENVVGQIQYFESMSHYFDIFLMIQLISIGELGFYLFFCVLFYVQIGILVNAHFFQIYQIEIYNIFTGVALHAAFSFILLTPNFSQYLLIHD